MGTHCRLPGPWKCPLPVRALGGKPPSFIASAALASTGGARGWWSRPSWAKHPLNNTDNPEEGREEWRKPSWSTAPTAPCSLAVESLFGHKLHSEASYGRSFFQLAEFNGNTHLLKFQTWPVALWREDYLTYPGSLWITERGRDFSYRLCPTASPLGVPSLLWGRRGDCRECLPCPALCWHYEKDGASLRDDVTWAWGLGEIAERH